MPQSSLAHSSQGEMRRDHIAHFIMFQKLHKNESPQGTQVSDTRLSGLKDCLFVMQTVGYYSQQT